MGGDFSENYRSLADDEILKLWDERSQLVTEARTSLGEEIRRRSLTVEPDATPKRTAHVPIRKHESEESHEYFKVVRLAGQIILGATCAMVPVIILSDILEIKTWLFTGVLLIPFTILFTAFWDWMLRRECEQSADAMQEECGKRLDRGESPFGE